MNLSKEMRRVLGRLRQSPNDATGLKCSISTLQALERQKLIQVETTFSAIVYPRKARATITRLGEQTARQRS